MKLYVNERYLKTNKIDKNFKIINLTDVHFAGDKYSRDLKDAFKVLEELKPDMISLTGDFIDSLEYGVNYQPILREYLEYLQSICPTFMSFGSHDLELFLNHIKREEETEDRLKYQEEYFAFLRSIGGNFYPIFPESTEGIDIGDNITIYAYSYPDAEGPTTEFIHGSIKHMKKYLNDMNIDKSRYNILLCHCPICFFKNGKIIDDCGDFDLILSGHNHGGMLPHFLRFLPIGLLGPDRTLFPRKPLGMHENEKGTTIEISPGYLKVPGIVREDIPFLGEMLYKCNDFYSRETDLLNISCTKKIVKKMS